MAEGVSTAEVLDLKQAQIKTARASKLRLICNVQKRNKEQHHGSLHSICNKKQAETETDREAQHGEARQATQTGANTPVAENL